MTRAPTRLTSAHIIPQLTPPLGVIVWMVGKSGSQFVDEHGKASSNFQISLTLYFIGVMILGIFLGPLVVVLILVSGIALVYGVVMIIVNAVKAHNGEDGAYALSTHFLS